MAQPTTQLRPHQSSLILAGIASLILWVVPFFGILLLPLQYLNTHLHEFAHAFMAVITGGPVEYIHVYSGGSGVTLSGGSPFLVSSAGYVGATIIGGLMITFSGSERGAGIVLRTIAGVLLFSMVFWVRGDAVGIASGLFWIALLFALPSFLRGRGLVFVAQLLGVQQCLSSVQALYILLNISAYPDMQSDAANMAQATHVPAIFWALLWTAIGLAVVLLTLRSAWKPRPDGSRRSVL